MPGRGWSWSIRPRLETMPRAWRQGCWLRPSRPPSILPPPLIWTCCWPRGTPGAASVVPSRTSADESSAQGRCGSRTRRPRRTCWRGSRASASPPRPSARRRPSGPVRACTRRLARSTPRRTGGWSPPSCWRPFMTVCGRWAERSRPQRCRVSASAARPWPTGLSSAPTSWCWPRACRPWPCSGRRPNFRRSSRSRARSHASPASGPWTGRSCGRRESMSRPPVPGPWSGRPWKRGSPTGAWSLTRSCG